MGLNNWTQLNSFKYYRKGRFFQQYDPLILVLLFRNDPE